MMASSDLDPLFIKALKLLQSRSKESRYQLRQLYDEVVAERKGELAMKQVSKNFESRSLKFDSALRHLALRCYGKPSKTPFLQEPPFYTCIAYSAFRLLLEPKPPISSRTELNITGVVAGA